MTIAEKIFAKHWVLDAAKDTVGIPAVKPGDQGFVRTDIRFSHEYVTPMAAIFFEELVGKGEPINDPSSVFFFRDHLTFLVAGDAPGARRDGAARCRESARGEAADLRGREGGEAVRRAATG